MQHRMKTHPLSKEQVESLLSRAQTACIATLNKDGSPYATPIHFLYAGGAVYFHGLPKGQKVDNINANSQVSMAVYEMNALLLDPNTNPCDTNTKYQSVIIEGVAVLLEEIEQKRKILKAIVEKYTPHLVNNPMPENMVRGTAVIKIDIRNITGKYYD